MTTPHTPPPKPFDDDEQQIKAQPALGVAHVRRARRDKNGWYRLDQKTPTCRDCDILGNVWFWCPEFAAVGPQRDLYTEMEGATHWQPKRSLDDDAPLPPNTKVTDAKRSVE